MKITKRQIRQIIKEELSQVLNEDGLTPYKVKAGDSPYSIAKGHGLAFDEESVAKLIQWNEERHGNIIDATNMQIGQIFHIPGELTATKLGLTHKPHQPEPIGKVRVIEPKGAEGSVSGEK